MAAYAFSIFPDSNHMVVEEEDWDIHRAGLNDIFKVK